MHTHRTLSWRGNPGQGFGALSKGLHWTLAVLMIGLIWLGWYMTGLDYYDRWYHASLWMHRVLGIIVLVLAIMALGWRLVSRRPGMAPTIRCWERIAARTAHATLYVMMVALPVVGYLISTSAGDPVPMFGGLEIPAWIAVNEEARNTVVAVHYYLAYTTAFLVVVHILAALKHHFIDRDDTLRGML
uniref:Cytochrome b561 n=1 Tax=Candidatus Kentrum sp. TC TaxID=2126339 RepID=A0A450YT93_9GAMM|nr:MAG: cytochrome b561 [Candidatus Kentron sp. TC]